MRRKYFQNWIFLITINFRYTVKIFLDLRKLGMMHVSLLKYFFNEPIYSYLNLEEHQTKIPGSHMIIAAVEKGIYSTWISYFDVEKVANLLRLPHNYTPSEIIAFGYPESEPKVRCKKSILVYEP